MSGGQRHPEDQQRIPSPSLSASALSPRRSAATEPDDWLQFAEHAQQLSQSPEVSYPYASVDVQIDYDNYLACALTLMANLESSHAPDHYAHVEQECRHEKRLRPDVPGRGSRGDREGWAPLRGRRQPTRPLPRQGEALRWRRHHTVSLKHT